MEKVKITYVTPAFHRRCFANLLDFIIFLLAFVALFLGARGIVSATPTYQKNMASLNSIRTDSGLYHIYPDTGRSVDIVSYLDNGGFDDYNLWLRSREAIDKFIAYSGEHGYQDSQQKIQADYDSYRLSFTYNGVKGFAKNEEGVIEETAEFKAAAGLKIRYQQAYAPYIDNHLQGYLVTEIPAYTNLVHYEANMLFFAEVIPAYALGGILVYLVPVLIFRRGRMTFGKAAYRIGLADENLLVPKMGTTLARFAIFYFGELLLSLFTFAIPFLISFSLMAFTKKKQGFPDYMLRLREVDCSEAKLYFSKSEIRLQDIPGHGNAPDFKMTHDE